MADVTLHRPSRPHGISNDEAKKMDRVPHGSTRWSWKGNHFAEGRQNVPDEAVKDLEKVGAIAKVHSK